MSERKETRDEAVETSINKVEEHHEESVEIPQNIVVETPHENLINLDNLNFGLDELNFGLDEIKVF